MLTFEVRTGMLTFEVHTGMLTFEVRTGMLTFEVRTSIVLPEHIISTCHCMISLKILGTL